MSSVPGLTLDCNNELQRAETTMCPKCCQPAEPGPSRGSRATLRGRGCDPWQGNGEKPDETGHTGSKGKQWPGMRRHHAGDPSPGDSLCHYLL